MRGISPFNFLIDMDIDLLSKMVGELILDSDEVSLPGVGVFVAEVMPSTFSDKGYTINPPYRRLSFRQRESSDNGLVELYARSNGIELQQAASIMEKFLSELKDTLKTRKTIVFPGLGRLRATRENNFFFIPDEDLNIYPEGFGLEPVSLKTHVETEDEMREAVASLQHILGDEASLAGLEPSPREEAPAVQEVPDAKEAPEVYEAPEVKVEEVIAHVPEVKAQAVVSPTTEAKVEAVASPAPEAGAAAVPVRRRSRWWVVPAAVLAAAAVFLAGFVLLAHIAPGFIDSILYSEEELDIIRQMQL